MQPFEAVHSHAPILEKPTLYTLRLRHGLHLTRLAESAGVPPHIVYFMLVGTPVYRRVAATVIQAFSQQVGIPYDLETVSVAVWPEMTEEEQSADNRGILLENKHSERDGN